MHRNEKLKRVLCYLPISLLLLVLLPVATRAQQWTASTNSSNNISNNNSGNVGIGTSAPTTKTDIWGTGGTSYTGGQLRLFDTTPASVGTGGELSFSGYFNGTSLAADRIGSIKAFKSNSTQSDYSFDLAFATRANGSNGVSEVMRLTAGGRVGIGTAIPDSGSLLDVRGNISLNGAVPSAHATTAYKALWLQNNVAVMPEAASGYSVINLTSNLQRTSATTWGFVDPTKSAWGVGVGSGPGFDQFSIYRSSSGTFNYVPLMIVSASGSVGIGTPTPAYKLDVNGTAHVSGDMTVDGNIAAKYQDVAEWVPSSQKLIAGTVVVLDTTKTNHVLASSKSYDTAVAGVVSDSPGVLLGQGGDDKLKVATTGRVKVRVDATRAPIHVGDLLVTSDAEGVAMKSVPIDLGGTLIHRPGTIIGKALEPLDKGTGEILVLLSLQ